MSTQKLLPDIERARQLGCDRPCDIEHARRVIVMAGTVNADTVLRALVYRTPANMTGVLEEIRFATAEARAALLLARKEIIAVCADHGGTNITLACIERIDHAVNRLDGAGANA